jgi:hypothetical protein
MSRAFFLGGKLGQLLTKKRRGSELSTGSFGKKRANNRQISRKKKWKSPYLEHRFLYVVSIDGSLKNILFFCFSPVAKFG